MDLKTLLNALLNESWEAQRLLVRQELATLLANETSTESETPLTVAQFADRMNGSRQWIHDLIRKGLIPARKLGGKTVIYPSEVKKVLPTQAPEK